jgi:spoIIIJ-associated protein
MSTPDDNHESEIQIEGSALAIEITQSILSRMGYDSVSSSRVVLPADADDSPALWIDVSCADAEPLLDYHHEGLDALQLLVQTMWSHKTKSRARITVDLNGYKVEKQDKMAKMALRMAERVVTSGRAVMLEPMTAGERRMVHMALRDHAQVYSESQGMGESRRVVIKLKQTDGGGEASTATPE